MSPEAKVRAVIMAILREGLDETFGEGAALRLPDGEHPNDATSFTIELEDDEVFVVEVTRLCGPRV